MKVTDWTITGFNGQVILGNTHCPQTDQPVGVLIICHGFKGYKDYGFFPYLGKVAAESGLIAHRFNFSHSGMTNNIETFERPDLFEVDTWNKQVYDLQQVHRAVTKGELAGHGLPIAWFGHSRGGVTTLLAAGRGYGSEDFPRPDALITAAAPDEACYWDEQTKAALKKEGKIESPSARTGQVLMVSRVWIDEIEADEAGHDVMAAASVIDCPILVIHGETDPTVPLDCAERIVKAAGNNAKLHVIKEAAHTFNAPNPLGLDTTPPAEAMDMMQTTCHFAVKVFSGR